MQHCSYQDQLCIIKYNQITPQKGSQLRGQCILTNYVIVTSKCVFSIVVVFVEIHYSVSCCNTAEGDCSCQWQPEEGASLLALELRETEPRCWEPEDSLKSSKCPEPPAKPCLQLLQVSVWRVSAVEMICECQEESDRVRYIAEATAAWVSTGNDS